MGSPEINNSPKFDGRRDGVIRVNYSDSAQLAIATELGISVNELSEDNWKSIFQIANI